MSGLDTRGMTQIVDGRGMPIGFISDHPDIDARSMTVGGDVQLIVQRWHDLAGRRHINVVCRDVDRAALLAHNFVVTPDVASLEIP